MRHSIKTVLRAIFAMSLIMIFMPACADMAFDGSDGAPNAKEDNGKADGSDGLDPSQGAPGSETMDDDPAAPLEPPTLSNRYAISLDSWISVLDGPDDDMPSAWTARFTGIVTTKMEDGQVVLTVAPCTVQLPDIDGREVEANDTMIQRAAPAYLTTTLDWDETGARLSTDLGAMVAGVDLSDPVNDTMPTDDGDERLMDIDEDGRPAMTLKISGYRVYVGLRVKLNLDGAFLENGYIRGRSGVRVDVEVYGDSVPFVDVKAAMDRALGKLSLSDERHDFVMVPLDDAITTCEEIPTAAFEVPTSDPSETDSADSEGENGNDEPAPTPAEPAPTPAEPAPTPADND